MNKQAQSNSIQFSALTNLGLSIWLYKQKSYKIFLLSQKDCWILQSGEKMQLFKLRPLVVSGPDSCTGQSVCPVGLPAVCRGAPHVSDHTSPRTQRMLCKNSHPCSGQYRLHHAGIVVTNQNLWNWLSNIFMLSTCLGCTRAGCHITWSPLPILIFFYIIFGVSSKYLIKKIREVHIIAAIQYNRS